MDLLRSGPSVDQRGRCGGQAEALDRSRCTQCAYTEPVKLVFFETPVFSRLLPDYLDDEGYWAPQRSLPAAPDLGDVMP